MAKAKIMKKLIPPATSWWSERRNLLTSLKPKSVRAKPRIKGAKAKAKPKSVKAKNQLKRRR
jgi:hypothetical protein